MRIIIFIIVLSFTACIPRQKVIYLQSQQGANISDSVNVEPMPEHYTYSIASGDILSVKIESITPEKYGLKEKDPSGDVDPILSGYLVDEKGDVDIPYIGKVKVIGLTLSEAQIKIKNEAADKLINPVVKVKLLSFSYTLLGEVNRPGTFRSYKGELTLFEAIGNAGDLTDFAERSKVKVVRMIDGEMTIEYVNLLNRELITSPYFYLRPGDIIYIPPMKVKNFAKYQLPNMAWAISVLSVISLFFIRLN
ncbi:MAG: polysaccharide biosynthesis/export family protein [Fulvivirga sp.]